jgi:hypothetical protein
VFNPTHARDAGSLLVFAGASEELEADGALEGLEADGALEELEAEAVRSAS